MGSPLSPATDIYSLGLVLLECIKRTVEYPGSAVESAVARLHRAPEIPADVPAEWADLIRSMTAIEPSTRPSAGEVEIALRQALVSPVSTPGELQPETTRVLPAMPFRPPSIAYDPPSRAPSGGTSVHQLAPPAEKTAASRRPGGGPATSRLRRKGKGGSNGKSRRNRRGRANRIWLWAVLAVLTALAGMAAFTASLSRSLTPDVVPYPTVTGTLGDHLKELQKSVQP